MLYEAPPLSERIEIIILLGLQEILSSILLMIEDCRSCYEFLEDGILFKD